MAAVRLRRVLTNELGLIIGGVLSVLFGIVLLVAPLVGALAIAYLIGAYAVIFGITLLVFAWRLREHQSAADRPSSMGAATA